MYTIPYDGLYLVHARVYGVDKSASHSILVDGDVVTNTHESDSDLTHQSDSTSIVLHLLAGQDVYVDPNFSGTINGYTAYMFTSFGATLLYAD